jgi:hypothetical protein
MKSIYSIPYNKYQAVSYKTDFLFEKYDAIISLLTRLNLKQDDLKRICKPNQVSQDKVEWQGDFTDSMKPLSDFDNNLREKFEKEYSNWWKIIHSKANQLKTSGELDSKQWGELIIEAFKEETNIIISNGTEWAVIWGWKFNNHFEFLPKNWQIDEVISGQVPPPPPPPKLTPPITLLIKPCSPLLIPN